MAPAEADRTPGARRWPVDLQAVYFLGPVEPQAENLAVHFTVLADDADRAEAVADQVVELTVGYLMHHDPPGLLEPMMTDIRIGSELG